MSITRRDFLNGVALTVAAGLTPAAQLAAQPARYPPALTGLRGQHDGSFEVAHAFAREGRRFTFGNLPIEERYDLVVVGGGLSGLAAAWFYRSKNPQARILILDNHDDFGGHAKRNEFTIGERRIIGYGGSQSFQSPNSFYGPAAKGLLQRTRRRHQAVRDRVRSRSLSFARPVARRCSFAREAFGRDVLVAGDAPRMERRETHAGRATTPGRCPNSWPTFRSRRRARRSTSRSIRRSAIRSPAGRRRRSAPSSSAPAIATISPRSAAAATRSPTSFRDARSASSGSAPTRCRRRTCATSAIQGLPGSASARPTPAWSEPYIYHFPDGNASLARLMVRALIPGVAPGNTMDDVVHAPFDYARLDDSASNVRIRLDFDLSRRAQRRRRSTDRLQP